MLEYFFCVSLNASIWVSSSVSWVRVVLPSLSKIVCREHLYVEMVHDFISSIFSFMLRPLGVVRPFEPIEPLGLERGTEVVAAGMIRSFIEAICKTEHCDTISVRI